ncbi:MULTISPECIES: Eco57I restriction-modification methylase domain-containing protein [unclassified Campylobacter]|uniref:Eco57I restriction-modification methylase domain-containing protein n=1 Tax=unclassified Campylobacter TaxID=2593542 RepID=UPI0022EA0280|nr:MULTISPECIES: N-6 DNA methylase [unclassified Campylobacter]MDA3054000.1 Eco57I restriction-modification methylase domain-containing protein [Campylobacter sp. VBCF_07 NA4]MDA3060113.1 Eco57I restriction-modification methylase domain-containing protein [Campylobacter sp. VBCF_02 NA5]MDA3069627.1 Eco57I restriction-modification methylase domain-containing protein [Campylobacter sp. VBCF_08 NA3]WBR55039.1 Eco57I restriction-modification methylase domain-containing protein [Campylobacter sp. VB
MALFKEKIIKEQKQDEKTLNERYENFLKFQAKIDAIKGYKEEEYQTDFLHDIFEACLGYTLKTTNPQNFNLARESKNETDSKKADGAILDKNGEVIGVIELKDQKTHDLDKIENQAFNYHNSNSKSRYIIISNFDEIRLYIDKKTAYEKFSLFAMTRDEFELFHQIFCFENINSFKTIDLRDKSENSDREISKRLYNDFAEFRLKLFENAVQENPQISPKEILSLVQKLCDRIIFVLFAEDYGLLKSNFVADINTEWQNQKFTDFSLYEIWQKYFEAIDKGNQKLGVENGYNGGLFATDETLNSLKFDDEILQIYTEKLSKYDFASEVGVNILGHIFEQSLSDLEELTAQVENKNFDKKDSKRKKDGIFYTPEYIVNFIVSQTLGEICENEKTRLNLHEIAIPKNPKRLSKAETQTLENIRAYKEFLLNLKVIDPACGSGAFLNGALDFLINEHKNLDKFRKIYENETLPLYDIDHKILENNLFGVDINADAVQIAKLSLWLRTAQKGRKLTDLSNNIKCANSLLDFPFDFKFDCVLGNPPYVRQEMIKEQKPHLQKLYKAYCGTADLFVYFYELGLNLLKNGGLLGFICSNKFFRASYGQNLRELILQNSQILAIADFNGVKVFDDATVDSAITILQKNSVNSEIAQPCHCEERSDEAIQRNSDYLATSKTANAVLDCFDDKSSRNDSAQSVIARSEATKQSTSENYQNANSLQSVIARSEATKQSTSENYQNANSQNSEFKLYSPNLQDFATLQTANLKASGFIFLNPLEANLKAKIERLGTPLKDWDININYGIKTGLNEAFIIDKATRAEILSGCGSQAEFERTQAIIKPILRGRDIKRYCYSWAKIYLINFHNGYTCADGVKIPPLDIADFPSLKKHFDKFEPALSKRSDKGATPYNLRNCAYLEEFEKEKIIWAILARSGNAFTLDTEKFYIHDSCFYLNLHDNSQNIRWLLAFLNNPLSLFYLEQVYTKLDITGWQWKKAGVEKIPIPKISKEKEAEFVNLVDKILKIKNQSEISGDDEIMLKVLDKELNSLVYKLYDLSDDEIALIENA